MNATITQTYTASDRRYNLYTMTLDERANELRNAVCAYGDAHNHPDDAYILARGLLGCILDGDATVDLGQPEVDLIHTVTTWAESMISRYRAQNAAEIAEHEACEGIALTDTEILGYAIDNPPAEVEPEVIIIPAGTTAEAQEAFYTVITHENGEAKIYARHQCESWSAGLVDTLNRLGKCATRQLECATCLCALGDDDSVCPECGAVIPGRPWDLVIEPMYPEEVTTTLDQAQHSDEYRAFVAERVKLNRDKPSDHYDAALDDLMGFCRTNRLSPYALIQRATTEARETFSN